MSLLAIFVSSGAQAGAVIATVNGTKIYDEDLSRRLREDHGNAAVSQDIRQQALRSIMAEVAVDAAFGKAIKGNANLRAALDAQRRKFVLAAYDASRLEGIEVSPNEVGSFVSSHPDYFAARKTYHFSRIDLVALTASARAEMASRMPSFRDMAEMSPSAIQLGFAWAQNPAFDLSMSRNWSGSEQVIPTDLAVLKQLDAGTGKVRVQCEGQSCHIFVLHASYPDPIDPIVVGNQIAQQLKQIKAAQVIDKANADLLAHADVKIDDAALAATLAKTSSSLVEDTNATLRRLIWSGQILNWIVSLGCAVLILRKDRGKYRRPSYLVVVSYERYVRITIAFFLPVLFGFSGLIVLSGTPINKPAIDIPVIAAITLCCFGLAIAAYRYVRGLRRVLRLRRSWLLLLLGTQAALLSTLA